VQESQIQTFPPSMRYDDSSRWARGAARSRPMTALASSRSLPLAFHTTACSGAVRPGMPSLAFGVLVELLLI
jgi:hypothetical protein